MLKKAKFTKSHITRKFFTSINAPKILNLSDLINYNKRVNNQLPEKEGCERELNCVRKLNACSLSRKSYAKHL